VRCGGNLARSTASGEDETGKKESEAMRQVTRGVHPSSLPLISEATGARDDG
jgi:hypothetical protein